MVFLALAFWRWSLAPSTRFPRERKTHGVTLFVSLDENNHDDVDAEDGDGEYEFILSSFLFLARLLPVLICLGGSTYTHAWEFMN